MATDYHTAELTVVFDGQFFCPDRLFGGEGMEAQFQAEGIINGGCLNFFVNICSAWGSFVGKAQILMIKYIMSAKWLFFEL